MKAVIDQDLRFEYSEYTRDAALAMNVNEPLKLEIIEQIPDGEIVSTYRHGDFEDLCAGPHVESSGNIPAFKLLNVAGAYWRGDVKRPMLQRIYGTAFESQTALDDFLHRLEESKSRDHRVIGRELGLFTTSELVGAGLPLWLPKGATIRRILEEYILGRERLEGYMHVYTPNLAKIELYKTSGHWDHYQDDMFSPMELENEEMVLRPMNCPHHILIYSHELRSYRDLPIRIGEIGNMYRYEKSGVVGGLSRVRAMALNDAHIFCTPTQVKQEFSNVMRLVETSYSTLGITDYSYRLSLRDTNDQDKYVEGDSMWDMAEQMLREVMTELDLDYIEAPGEAAFYGPKVDIQVRDVLGREETFSTIQIDFHLPNQFDLAFIDQDGQSHRPVIIHRGVLSTMERLVAYLIELYGGAFPTWLSPVQAVVVSIADRHISYAENVKSQLLQAGIRVEADTRNERMNSKIREAQLQKIPYMLIVGDREEKSDSVSVRLRSGEDLGAIPIQELTTRIVAETARYE
jgi:threonyl-tRNA synthetase